jgi:hypothetical protein
VVSRKDARMVTHKLEGALWEVQSLTRFRLVGWPFVVAWSPKGWEFFLLAEEGKGERFFLRSRGEAMRVGIGCLKEAMETYRSMRG